MVQAHSDISTGKIYGCKKGSFAWWHEKGHLVFGKSPEGSEMQLKAEMFFRFSITSLICAFLFFPLILVAIYYNVRYWYCFIYEEKWCDKYAKRKLYNKIKKVGLDGIRFEWKR